MSRYTFLGGGAYLQQNIYNILDKGNEDDTNNANTIITQMMAVETTGSMLGNAYANTTALTIPAEVTAAINQLSANQMAIIQQMAVMSFSPPPPPLLRRQHSISHPFKM
jgi:hypothetical protein